MTELWEGVLEGLQIDAAKRPAAPVSYSLRFADGSMVALNDRIGAGMQLRFLGTVACRYCGAASKRSFGGGYCYHCFSTLARCDLCVVSPDRCHYDAGTCREPAWGDAFCMQPHVVYLANSSGLKVGLTRQGREQGRWLDQGAIQGLVILAADSRRAAGLAEVQIGRLLAERTDWRRMLRADVPELDLGAARERLLDADLALPEGVRWLPARPADRFRYPLDGRRPPDELFRLERRAVSGNLKGMKAQYLLIGSGALNVRRHAGFRVSLRIGPSLEEVQPGGGQLGLFG